MDTVREIRKYMLMSRKEFSEFFQIPLITVTSWETGDRKPKDYVVHMMDYIATTDPTIQARRKAVKVCPHCGGKHMVKNGVHKNFQKYLCRDCGRVTEEKMS